MTGFQCREALRAANELGRLVQDSTSNGCGDTTTAKIHAVEFRHGIIDMKRVTKPCSLLTTAQSMLPRTHSLE